MNWKLIDENTPKDEPHVRGIWVYSSSTQKPLYWQADCGTVSDDGFFSLSDGDDAGWHPDDYTHWIALPPPPEAA
jgi:hypothetical protein